MTTLIPIKTGKAFTLMRRDPAPTLRELETGKVSNYYVVHNEYGTVEFGNDQYYTALSNFNLLERVIASLEAGQTLQDVGKNEMMQRLVEAGALADLQDDPDSKPH